MSATIIIPTTGSPDLERAIDSVLSQTTKTTCYVVVDGNQYYVPTNKILEKFIKDKNFDLIKWCNLPINVGAKGFYGHRVYAAFTHLVDTEYIGYLDQDNWLDANHVKSCIDTIKSKNLDWCHSLRSIYTKDGKFVCRDDCESLGKHLAWTGVNHIDTNTYFLKTEIAIRIASAWHGGWGQDRVFLQAISQHFPKADCTGEYTVNYRVGGGPGSVSAEFFQQGNKIMNDKYKGELPWQKRI